MKSEVTPAKKKAKKKILPARDKRLISKGLSAVAAGYLPIGSYVLAHVEAPTRPYLWVLVAGALIYSAPTLSAWAEKWCGGKAKAWGFTLLLEGVMVASHITSLSMSALAILVSINAAFAWERTK